MTRTTVFLAAWTMAAAACGYETLTDFETPAEIAAAPRDVCSAYVTAVTNRFAMGGTNSLHVWKRVWKDGDADTKGALVNLTPRLTDWRGYDRLSMVVYNDGPCGDWMYLYAYGKQTPWDHAMYGKLTLPAHDYAVWTVPIAGKGPAFDPADVTTLLLQTSSKPKGFDTYVDRIVLLKPGEEPPPPMGAGLAESLLPAARRRAAELEERVEDLRGACRHAKSVGRFRDACRAAGTVRSGLCLGWAYSDEQVLPRDDFSARPATALSLRLARNEVEAVQLVVVPETDDGLRDVCVTVEGLDLPASVDVVGFVKTKRPPYEVSAVGWWPDVLLDFLGPVPVSGDDAQSFYIRVKCPKDAARGLHHGTVRVAAKDCAPVDIPLTVRVNGFAVPDTSMLLLALSFKPHLVPVCVDWGEITAEDYPVVKNDPESSHNVWARKGDAWVDFLADYKIVKTHIYNRPPWCHVDFRSMLRLKEQGRLDWFCLGSFDPVPPGTNGVEVWRAKCLPQYRAVYEEAKRLGILDKAYFYGADELHESFFERVNLAVRELKREFPEVPVLTTAIDRRLGLDGSALTDVDWFCPTPDAYDPALAARARAAGKKVWWYTANIPPLPYPQTCIETPAIVMRQLMGAMAVKFRPDGYLYYSLVRFRAKRPIVSGPFTDWPARSFRTWNGDGSWVYVGPGGRPLATLRLENFRDGLEDYAYAMLLEEQGEKVTVPDSVVRAANDYTHDSTTLRAWRDALADRLEAALAK